MVARQSDRAVVSHKQDHALNEADDERGRRGGDSEVGGVEACEDHQADDEVLSTRRHRMHGAQTRFGMSYANEFVQEDTAEVGAGGGVKREDARRAVGSKHDGVERTGCF